MEDTIRSLREIVERQNQVLESYARLMRGQTAQPTEVPLTDASAAQQGPAAAVRAEDVPTTETALP